MTRLLKAFISLDQNGNQDGIEIIYRIGNDERTLFLSVAEIEGLSTTQIKQLAQQKADQDIGLPGPTNEREDVLSSPIKQARQWFKNKPAAIAFLEKTPEEIDTQIDSMSLAQIKEVIKGCAIICRTLALLEIAD